MQGLTGLSFEELKNLPKEEQAQIINEIKKLRLKAKRVNFASLYGAGPPKISLSTGMELSEAKFLHTTYWKRNIAVKQVSEACITKRIGGLMWLYNPVSGFWYSLRVEKDKFSTLNQGCGVFCFDTWVRFVRQQQIKVCGQFHDKILLWLNFVNCWKIQKMITLQ